MPITADDAKVHDENLRIMLRRARTEEELTLANMRSHPVRKYYQLRAMLSDAYHKYRGNNRTTFVLKSPTTPRLTTVF